MATPGPYPPLKFLHPASSLSSVKLAQMDKLSTDMLKYSLRPGLKDSLKVKPDGTVMDGHHRIFILQKRRVDIDALPREIIWNTDP